MSSVAQTNPTLQAIPDAIVQFRPSICPICLQPPPESHIMNRVRILKLKTYANVWSMRCRCPRPECRADYSIWLSFTEQDGLMLVTLPDAMVFAYAQGRGTTQEIAEKHGLQAGSSVWRAVDAAIKEVKECIGNCVAFLKQHEPEALNELLQLQPPLSWSGRRFRLPERVQCLALLRELPKLAKACIKALKVEWPYGVLRFLRSITPRFANLYRSD